VIRIDTEAVALILGWTPNRVRVFAFRHPDQLPKHGKDSKRRTLYRLEDAERVREAEGATRETAVLPERPRPAVMVEST
jgi:hypothetical protein